MLHLLFSVIFSQMFMILLLLFRTPLRKYVIMSLDKMKRGRGPVVVTTVAATVLVVFISTVNSIFIISRREIEPGAINPTDLVLMARSLLDASLMGFILFLGLMTDRLHYYIRELRLLRRAMEASQKQNQRLEAEAKSKADEIAALKYQVETLKSECAAKADAARTAERNVEALKRQSEGLLGEYDRMFEDNQNLRRQLRYIDENLSRSVVKKNM